MSEPVTHRRAVFVDKDGTLIEDVPYNVDPHRLRFMPHALSALAALQRAGFALVIASNQSGIARGLFGIEQFLRLRAALEARLIDEAGVLLHDVVFCPHAPDARGRPQCACRKPRPGLLTGAAAKHGLDLRESWMVGDTLDDVEAGQRAGCRSVLFDSGGETLWQQGPMRCPHAVRTDWRDVAALILAQSLEPLSPSLHAGDAAAPWR